MRSRILACDHGVWEAEHQTDASSAIGAWAFQLPCVGDALSSQLQTPFLHVGRAYPRKADADKGHSSHSHSAPAHFSWLRAFFIWFLSDFNFIHFLFLFEGAVQVLAQLD